MPPSKFPQFFFLLAKLGIIVSHLKATLDLLLHRSFFNSSVGPLPPPLHVLHSIDSLTVRRDSSGAGGECAVCLCGLEEGDEIRELKCGHMFHRVCLDRWVGCGHWTCPLCRNHLRLVPPIEQQQVVVFRFCDFQMDSGDGGQWWLR